MNLKTQMIAIQLIKKLIQKKFLSTKKSSYNSKNYKTAIDNYYLRIKSLEIYRFDYICSVNKILMMKQIEFPQLISLLTFSLMVFFRQIHEALKEIEAPIKDNLEKINARIVLKDKIMQNMKKEKKYQIILKLILLITAQILLINQKLLIIINIQEKVLIYMQEKNMENQKQKLIY